ncbi:MAG TPA: DNA polymerase I, partial [Acidimicrobiales bacterium]|nr:DNA polymerase I [Acidimicrobiales bacterium]
MAKVMLLDGNSLAYRAFFALPTDLATASGQVTNAVYGFTSMLINLLKDHAPDAIAVAFDRPEPTFRHELVADYKAGRSEAPDILRQQMGLVRQVVETLRIPIVEAPGYEADDVIATLATQARDRGDEVVIVTGDRDTYQLVEDPYVRVLYNRRGVSDYVLYDEAGIVEKTGVHPRLYPQYAALRGDPSDNLPGVPGVGEKTAARLINTYGDLDGVFAHVAECTPKLRASLAASEAQVRANAQATPLVRDLDLPVALDDLKMGPWDPEQVRSLFGFLEFRTLYDRLIEATGDQQPAPQLSEPLDVEVVPVRDAERATEVLRELEGPLSVAAAWEGEEARSPLKGVAIAEGGGGRVARREGPPWGRDPEGQDPAPGGERPWWFAADVLQTEPAKKALTDLFAPGGPPLHAHNAKVLIRGLDRLDVDVHTLDVDTAVAAYLIDPAESQYVLEDLALRYLGLELRSPDAPPPGQLDLDGGSSDPSQDAGRRAAAVARLAPRLAEVLDTRSLRSLYDNVERPLVRVLARMEKAGVRVDVAQLRQLYEGLVAEGRQLEVRIQELAGEPFRVNSTPQLRHILFDKLGLQPQKKTKTGFSTDAASLEKLRGQHEIIEPLLRYREVEKLRSTYGESLLGEVGDDGRIHATFNQTVARTGRLSSDRPNLHNIPIRTEEGRQIRRAFIPAEGCRFLVADYNQIELRVIAHLAQDPGLIEAFASGQDIHRATAARIFGADPSGVTIGQRSKAKMVSYGLAYGMEAYGLGQRLGITTEEAAAILDAYFEAFPSVRSYMERTVAEARDRGYTETLFGRRRQIPELSSTNYRLRQAGERQAMNAGIQGLAADIFKVALVRLDRSLEQTGRRSRLVLQVHDEVILEVPPDEEQAVATLTLEAMRGAAELSVPLEVNLSWGDSWADAKG